MSIGTEQLPLGIEGLPSKLTVIAVTIDNPGDSARSLVVGTFYNNADHWNVTANLMHRDGKIAPLSRLPGALMVTGNVKPVVVEIPAHGSYRALLDAENFEERIGNGSTNLAGVIGGSGDQLQIVVHCGTYPNTSSWKGDLVSGWLKI
jgi:hypothetical protein